MSVKHLIRFNILIFVFYISLFYLKIDSSFFQIIKAFFGFLFIFISGLNLAILFKMIFKKDLDSLELMNFTFLNIFILIPIILFIESALLKRTYPIQSVLTLSTITLLTLIFLFFQENNHKDLLFKFPTLNIKKILLSQITWVIILEVLVISTIVFLYKFLPDKDPFFWYVRLTQYFESNALSEFSFRPLFYSISFLFYNITDIGIFFFLKYIIAFLFLSSFFPICLIARDISEPRKRILILMVPFLAPNTILYSSMGMPQVFFMILLYYFIFFLFYSYSKKDKLYYYAAGIIALGCALYHETGIIVFIIWLAITLIYKWKKIISNKKDALLLIIIFFSNLSLIKSYINFVSNWTREVLTSLSNPHFNYAFPIKYIDINGLETGSQNIIGVAKTYLGYVGPVIIFFIFAILYLLLRKKIETKKYLLILKKSSELQIILACFFVFFSIAEILPRFPGIALLPDRAWIFTSIFFSFFIIFFANTSLRISKGIFCVYAACIFFSIGGAIYSNYPKKDLISKEQIKSAEWIKKELPKNRIIIADGQYQLLKYFSQSKVYNVNDNFFNEKDSINLTLNNLRGKTILNLDEYKERDDKLKKYAESITSKTSGCIYKYLNSKDVEEKNIILREITSYNIELSKNFADSLELSNATIRPEVKIYIYYTNSDKNRFSNDLILDKYPNEFKKMYNSSDNSVIIWKVL